MKEIVEFVEEVGGLYLRSVMLPARGMRVSQHAHPYDHVTLCGSGSAMLFIDGAAVRSVLAGHAIELKAGMKHEFVALEDETRLTCVHDTRSAEFIRKAGL